MWLQEGDVIELPKNVCVYANVPKHFVYSNKRGCFDLTHEKVRIKGDFDYLRGTYIVIKTSFEGGGKGHGPHDTFPNGHHVFCEKIDNPNEKVDFFQSGSFSAMITDIKPIGKAKLKWTIEKGTILK
jgi:hypothetical protein